VPSWKSLVPRKFLEAEDLPQGEVIPVVIRGVRQIQFKAQGAPGQTASVDIVLGMDLHGYQLPMRLNVPTLKRIEALLGTDDVAVWANKRINIYAGLQEVYGEMKPRIIVDDRPPVGGTGGPAGRIAGAPGSVGLLSGVTAKLGRMHVDRFRETAAGMGGSWDGFMAWLKHGHPAGYELAFGKDLDNIPGSLVLLMKSYLDELKEGKKQLPPPQPDPAMAALQGQPPEPSFVPEEDIPF